jgi:ATP-dependent Clp protease ATP-binding subunit ClpA
MGDESRAEAADCDVRRELRHALKPEFVNRVRMIHFNRLGRSSAERILDLELEQIARRYRDLHGLDLLLDSSARGELIRRGFSPAFGARHLAATLEAACNVEIAKKVLRDDASGGSGTDDLVDWLREIRSGARPYHPDEVRRRVCRRTRARLAYDSIRILFRDDRFVYRAEVRADD